MFRANRIGTPVFLDFTDVTDVSAMTWSTAALTTKSQPFNSVNASAAGQLTRSTLAWAGTAAAGIPAGHKAGLAQQIAIDPPPAANWIGIEVSGSIVIDCGAVPLIPFITNMNNVTGLLAAGTPLNIASYHYDSNINAGATSALTPQVRTVTWRYQAVINNLGLPVSVAAGAAIQNTSSGTNTPTYFQFQQTVRQWMDQEGVTYGDTRR